MKVGVASNVQQRLGSLQIGNPYRLVLLKVIKSHTPFELENMIHNGLHKYRRDGEWFELPDKVLELLLKSFPD